MKVRNALLSIMILLQ